MNGLCLVTYADAGNYCCSVVVPWAAIAVPAVFVLILLMVIVLANWEPR